MSEGRSGYLPILGFRQYYRSFGPEHGAATVLCLHGGPGASHDYLLPLADLTRHGYRVVMFDQLGCGESEVPDDRSLFTLEHHVLETEAVRNSLGLGRVHLLGSSYGGLLALAYTLAHPEALRSLTTVGGLASVPFTSAEMARLRAELPASVRATLDRCEASGATGSAEYKAAAMEFYRRHVLRLSPWPPEVERTFELIERRPVYALMNGPSEFTITGTIRDIDLSSQLPRIRTPTLVLGGRYDEVSPAVAQQIASAIPGARSVTFSESSHLPFWEERERFMAVLSSFLRSVDGQGAFSGGRSGP
jgi:proline iminopeptidase